MIEPLTTKLNSYHPKVQFTVEIEDATTKSINFLDTTVFNCGGKLMMKWFFKPIASNRLLNFHSSHPKNMVLNVAKSFIRRIVSLTHKTFESECLATAKEILEKNSFPTKVIEQLIHQVKGMAIAHASNLEKSYAFLDQTEIINPNLLNVTTNDTSTAPVNRSPLSTNSHTNPLAPEKKFYVGMTYIPNVTEAVTKQIKKHVPNLCAAPRPASKVGNLYSDMKEKLRIGQNSMVVYDIPCSGCHGRKGYIGETSWNSDDRCGPPGGHYRDLKNVEKNPRATALVHHVATTQHRFDFADKRILKKVRFKGLLKIHETNQILLKENYSINFKRDAEHVSPMYYNLLKQSERNQRSHMKSKCKPRTTSLPIPKYKY